MKIMKIILLYSLVCSAFGQVELIWSDEFDGEGAIDDTKWYHQTKMPWGTTWFNGEVQHYTNRVENTFQSNGTLKINAIKETFTDQGVTKEFTSARLNSKFAFTYGRIEIRAKLPTGVGTWPALWMLGKNISETGAYWQTLGYGTTGWPDCGELDIMEHWGSNQDYISSAIHSPSSYGSTVNVAGRNIPNVSNEFNIYTLDWTPESMIFAVNDTIHYTYDPEEKNSDTWPFDADMYLLMNVAILPGIESTFTESAMEVDYVRVYKYTNLETKTENFPKEFHIGQNYPNPFNPRTTIRYQVPDRTDIQIIVYNLRGQAVKTLVDEYQVQGVHYTTWNGTDHFGKRAGPGIYLCSIQAGNVHRTMKMVLLK